MRRSFRQFINESNPSALTSSGMGANAKWGFWGFPSLNQQGLQASRWPAGGYQNFTQIAQQKMNVARFNDEDYIFQQMLQSIANLAENLPENIKHNQDSYKNDPANFIPRHYKYASFNQSQKMIYGLTQNDIISGLYPRIKADDLSRAKQMGIVIPSQTIPQNHNQADGQLYDINIEALQEAMIAMSHKMADKEHGYNSAAHLTGVADKIANLATSGGMVSLGHNVNPMGGGR
jgi:hypothetical protein